MSGSPPSGTAWFWAAVGLGTAGVCLLVGDPFPLILLAAMAIASPRILESEDKQKLFLASLLARISILVLTTEVFSTLFDMPVIYTGGDSNSHYSVAEKLTVDFRWSNLWAPPLEGKKTFEAGTYHFGPFVIFHTGYVFFLSLFGHLSDLVHAHSKYSFIYADAIIGSLIPVLTFDIAMKVCKDREIARRAGILMAFYPLAIILSGIFMKDSLATFLLLLMVKALFYSKRRHLLLAGLAWGWLVLVRYKSALFIAPLIFFKWLFPKPAYSDWREFLGEFRTTRVKYTGVALGVAITVLTAKIGVISILVRVFVSTQEIMKGTTASGLTQMVYSLPGPLRTSGMVVMSLTMPLPPWRSIGVPDHFFIYTLFSDLGALYWYGCIPFVLIGLHVVLKERKHDVMVAGAFSFIIVSMAISYWIDDRRRLMALPFGFILCAIGFGERSRYSQFLAGMIMVITFSGVAYVVLKT